MKNATKKSLLVLDEIGRGTSTYDGLSIAWAVSEYISGLINLFPDAIISIYVEKHKEEKI